MGLLEQESKRARERNFAWVDRLEARKGAIKEKKDWIAGVDGVPYPGVGRGSSEVALLSVRSCPAINGGGGGETSVSAWVRVEAER